MYMYIYRNMYIVSKKQITTSLYFKRLAYFDGFRGEMLNGSPGSPYSFGNKSIHMCKRPYSKCKVYYKKDILQDDSLI